MIIFGNMILIKSFWRLDYIFGNNCFYFWKCLILFLEPDSNVCNLLFSLIALSIIGFYFWIICVYFWNIVVLIRGSIFGKILGFIFWNLCSYFREFVRIFNLVVGICRALLLQSFSEHDSIFGNLCFYFWKSLILFVGTRVYFWNLCFYF